MQPTKRVLQRSGIKKGMTVLEIGCGNGAYIPTAARMVGPKGTVHALDIQPEMLLLLEENSTRRRTSDINNVFLHQADALKLPFENEQFDVVFMVAALSEIPDVPKALKEVNVCSNQMDASRLRNSCPTPITGWSMRSSDQVRNMALYMRLPKGI